MKTISIILMILTGFCCSTPAGFGLSAKYLRIVGLGKSWNSIPEVVIPGLSVANQEILVRANSPDDNLPAHCLKNDLSIRSGPETGPTILLQIEE